MPLREDGFQTPGGSGEVGPNLRGTGQWRNFTGNGVGYACFDVRLWSSACSLVKVFTLTVLDVCPMMMQKLSMGKRQASQ